MQQYLNTEPNRRDCIDEVNYCAESCMMRVGPCWAVLSCLAVLLGLALVGVGIFVLATQRSVAEYHAVTSIEDLGNGTYAIGIRCSGLTRMVIECGLLPPDLDSYVIKPCTSDDSTKYGRYIVPCDQGPDSAAYIAILEADQGGKETDHSQLALVISVSVVIGVAIPICLCMALLCGATCFGWLMESSKYWDTRG